MENYFVLAWIAIAGLFMVIHQLGNILDSLRHTESMTRRLLVERGIEWQVAVEPSAEVKRLVLQAGAEIAAIRAYRQQTGLGSREAKAVIDRLREADNGTA